MKKGFNNMMKTLMHIRLICFFLFAIFDVSAQGPTSITLEECYSLATDNYPLIRQKEILTRIKDFNLENAGKGLLPQVIFNAQATYQSEVTQIPFEFPGLEISSLSKDQYKAYVDINQPLTEGRLVRQQKQLIEAKTVIEEKKLEADLYTLKERINQVYFGILLIKEQIKQVALLKKDIQSGITTTNTAIANGIALKSSADILKAEFLKSEQRTIELNAGLNGYIQMLELLIHKPLDISTEFQTPSAKSVVSNISRPELKLFDAQKESFELQSKMISTRKIPKLGLFLQAGYGKPGFNFLANKFDFYYIGGIRFIWPLASLYTSRNDRQLLVQSQDMIEVQKETFLFNTNLSLSRQESEITKYEELIEIDHQIIDLYENTIHSYTAQLENGTITSTEYLTHVNTVDVARQNLVLHQAQLLLAQYTYNTTSGN
ncbi:MAG TPA: TolC family protein [Saprospiraceae bacterium]|nr:TolC family protein [Saprospiraceae bacterium]